MNNLTDQNPQNDQDVVDDQAQTQDQAQDVDFQPAIPTAGEGMPSVETAPIPEAITSVEQQPTPEIQETEKASEALKPEVSKMAPAQEEEPAAEEELPQEFTEEQKKQMNIVDARTGHEELDHLKAMDRLTKKADEEEERFIEEVEKVHPVTEG